MTIPNFVMQPGGFSGTLVLAAQCTCDGYLGAHGTHLRLGVGRITKYWKELVLFPHHVQVPCILCLVLSLLEAGNAICKV